MTRVGDALSVICAVAGKVKKQKEIIKVSENFMKKEPLGTHGALPFCKIARLLGGTFQAGVFDTLRFASFRSELSEYLAAGVGIFVRAGKGNLRFPV